MNRISAGGKYFEGNKTGWCDGWPGPSLSHPPLMRSEIYHCITYLTVLSIDKALYSNNPIPCSEPFTGSPLSTLYNGSQRWSWSCIIFLSLSPFLFYRWVPSCQRGSDSRNQYHAHDNVNESPGNCAKWQKPDPKRYRLCDFIYITPLK